MDYDSSTSPTIDSWTGSGGSHTAFEELVAPARPPARVRPHLRAIPSRDFSDEEFLVERLRLGDEAAFAYLTETYRERLSAVAWRYFSEEEDVRDAVQDALLAAFRAIHGFQEKAALSTWLHRIVVNACLMKLRSRRRKPEQSLNSSLSAVLVSATASSAHAELEAHELSAQVRAAIAALPEPHRSVIRLRDLEERDTRETARALSISPAAVKTRLHRARGLLRAQLLSRSDPSDPSGHYAASA